jgi:ribosomal-protein-alanine N-acetyltransferase
MILKTERLVLRPMAVGDAAGLFAILGDPEAMAFWHREPLPRLATVEAQMADELAAMAAGGFFYWTVLQNCQTIGSIDLSHSDGEGAWTGFALRRDVWGQGLAREALASVIAHAFGPLQLNHLSARVQSGNARALRLLGALGFYRKGDLPDIARGGERRACALYRLDRSATRNGE